MGEKSKRKGNNKPAPCYHGCQKKEFNNSGEHYTVVEAWDDGHMDIKEFYFKYKRVLEDATLGNFVIAHITNDYLKGKDDALLYRRLRLLVDLRYVYIPTYEGKDVGPKSKYIKHYKKYMRNIKTKRG